MRILHISDLHASSDDEHNRDLVLNAFFEDIASYADDIPIDIAVFTGDLAFSGRSSDYERAQEAFLEPLLRVIRAPRERLILVPGNHDVDRSTVREAGGIIERGIAETLTDAGRVDDFMSAPAQYELARKRMDAWYSFHETFYANEPPESLVPFGFLHRIRHNGLTVAVGALNSAWRATGEADDVDRQHLLVGRAQYEPIFEAMADADIKIAAFHHPLEWLMQFDHASLRGRLERDELLVMTGHEHDGDPSYIASTRGAALYSRAGSLYGGREWTNGYSLLDVDCTSRTTAITMRAWQETSGFVPDTRRGNETIRLPWPAGAPTLSPLGPSYPSVVATLAEISDKGSLVAGKLRTSDSASLLERLVPPRFLPAPLTQLVAARQIAHSQGQEDPLPQGRPLDALNDSKVLVVSGDALSGVTNALLFLLEARYSIDARRLPVYAQFEDKVGKEAPTRLLRSATRASGYRIGNSDPLPPLIAAIDDVSSDRPAALARLAEHIGEHSDNLYILGCHGEAHSDIAAALERAGIAFERVFLGPMGRRDLQEMIRRFGADDIASYVDRILDATFGSELPRTPFVFSALIAVLAVQPDLQPKSLTGLLDALVDIMLGRGELLDLDGLGMDYRAREHLLGAFAERFTLGGTYRLPRLDSEQFIAGYLIERGIERHVSPGGILQSLIERRIFAEDSEGVGFRHLALQNLLAAKGMSERPSFRLRLLADPVLYREVLIHHAALSRSDKDLLRQVVSSAAGLRWRPDSDSALLFDLLRHSSGAPRPELTREQVAAEIDEAATTKDGEEERRAAYYEELELRSASDATLELPDSLADVLGQTELLTGVLAGSELVDDVALKTTALQLAIFGWAKTSDGLGREEAVRNLLKGVVGSIVDKMDVGSETREQVGDVIAFTTIVLGLGGAVAAELGVQGLAAALRATADDDDVMRSPTLALYVTLAYASARLSGWTGRLRKLYEAHDTHVLLGSVIRGLAVTWAISPETSDSDAQSLQRLVADIAADGISGRGGVGERDAERSRVLSQLQRRRLLNLHLPGAEGVEGLFTYDDGES